MKLLFRSLGILMLLWWLGVSQAGDESRVLVLRAAGDSFDQTFQGLKDDIGDEVELVQQVVGEETLVSEIHKAVDSAQPRSIVLLGNISLRLYQSYQQANQEQQFPPALALSALFVDGFLPNLKNATGIRYEIPAVTSLVQLRSLIDKPIRKVGLLYRSWMRDYYELNRKFAAEEGFELVGIELPNLVNFKQLNYHLRHLVRRDIDVLWVVNDNALLSERFMQNAWLPALRHFDRPVIVGIDTLTRTELNFGTYSVTPDHYDLGLQGAGLLVDIMDDDRRIGKGSLEEPLSTKKLLNLELSERKRIPVRAEHLTELDQIIR
jgi:hypothetical protein